MKTKYWNLNMASKMFLISAIFAVFALLSADAQDEHIVCSRDKTIRESLLKCIALMPSLHLEIIKECDSRVRNVQEGEHEKLLDAFCTARQGGGFARVSECITKVYNTRKIDQYEQVRPMGECMDEIRQNMKTR